MDAIPDRIYFKDLQSRFVRINAAHAKWLGVASPEDAVGKSDLDFFSSAHAAKALAEERNIIATGEPILGETQFITKADGTTAWGSTTKMPWRDESGRIIGTFGLTRDITAAKQAEERLVEERNLLRTIIDHLPGRVFVKDLKARYLINNLAHLRSLGVARQEDARGKTALDFFAGPRAQQALEDDRKVLGAESPILNEERSDFASGGGAHWVLTTKVPFRDLRGNVAGLVGISHDITRRKRTEEELQRRSAEMEADLQMARQIQEAFFPRDYPTFPPGVPPESSRLRFAHRYLAATTLGGDFFDVIPLSETRCGVLVSDVMGHGVRAGLLTALIRGVVEELVRHAADPAEVLGEINRALAPFYHQTGQPLFATAFFGVVDLSAGAIDYANAAHPAPFLLRRGDGKVERLTSRRGEPAAGLIEGFAYSSERRAFAPGSVLVGFTDGLTEATDPSGRMFGEEAVLDLIRKNAALPGPELLDGLVGSVKAFRGGGEFEDDLCLLSVESAGRQVTPTGG